MNINSLTVCSCSDIRVLVTQSEYRSDCPETVYVQFTG